VAQRCACRVRQLRPVQRLDCHLIALPLAVVHGAEAALAQLPTDGDCVPCNVEPAQLTVLQRVRVIVWCSGVKELAVAWASGGGGEGTYGCRQVTHRTGIAQCVWDPEIWPAAPNRRTLSGRVSGGFGLNLLGLVSELQDHFPGAPGNASTQIPQILGLETHSRSLRIHLGSSVQCGRIVNKKLRLTATKI
jgi:hypothetical protein